MLTRIPCILSPNQSNIQRFIKRISTVDVTSDIRLRSRERCVRVRVCACVRVCVRACVREREREGKRDKVRERMREREREELRE